MAKFRSGDLILQSDQEIIQGGNPILGANGAVEFVSLNVSGASALTTLGVSGLSTLDSLTVTGASILATLQLVNQINEFSIDGTLGDDSDSSVPTEKAVKTYVDAQVGGAVPPGTDEAIVRYNGINSVQDSGIFIDDSDNITGINNLNVDGTATIDTSLFCNDLYVSGDTIFVGTGQIKSTAGNVELYHDNEKMFETKSSGISVIDSDGTYPSISFVDSGGTAVSILENQGYNFNIRVGDIFDTWPGRHFRISLSNTSSGGLDKGITITQGAGAVLYHDDNTKFETTATGITVTGIIFADGLTLGDAEPIEFGAGLDGLLYSDGSSFAIGHGGGGEVMAKFIPNGAVNLYNNNNLRLETSSTGVKVTGILETDGITLGDNEDITFGAGPDAKMSSDGSAFLIENGAGTEIMARFIQNGGASLYYNNIAKFYTLSTGATVVGKLNADGISLGDNDLLTFGAGSDGSIYSEAGITGALVIAKGNAGETMAKFIPDGANEFYYNGAKVGETTAIGISGAVWG